MVIEFICNKDLLQNYGPKPGGETLEEARLREAREKAERERKIKEIEEMRRKQVNCYQQYDSG